MLRRFDPQNFPNRVIVVDMNTDPPAELMNCLGCGRLVRKLYKYNELCKSCYGKWEKSFREQWLKTWFGSKA